MEAHTSGSFFLSIINTFMEKNINTKNKSVLLISSRAIFVTNNNYYFQKELLSTNNKIAINKIVMKIKITLLIVYTMQTLNNQLGIHISAIK